MYKSPNVHFKRRFGNGAESRLGFTDYNLIPEISSFSNDLRKKFNIRYKMLERPLSILSVLFYHLGPNINFSRQGLLAETEGKP